MKRSGHGDSRCSRVAGFAPGETEATITVEVKGEILAESVTVNGKVYGTIRARTVLMGKTAHVEGDVYHETLAIEAGAYFEGAVRKLSKFQQQQAGKPIDAAKAPPPSAGMRRGCRRCG